MSVLKIVDFKTVAMQEFGRGGMALTSIGFYLSIYWSSACVQLIRYLLCMFGIVVTDSYELLGGFTSFFFPQCNIMQSIAHFVIRFLCIYYIFIHVYFFKNLSTQYSGVVLFIYLLFFVFYVSSKKKNVICILLTFDFFV
jgi:hypothetical protein